MTEILVITQYRENYSDTEVPYWKNKGGVTFRILSDKIDFFQPSEDLVEDIKSVLELKSNSQCQYVYVGHEVFFEEIEDISEEFHKRQ